MTTSRKFRFVPRLERLEDRTLLAWSPLGPGPQHNEVPANGLPPMDVSGRVCWQACALSLLCAFALAGAAAAGPPPGYVPQTEAVAFSGDGTRAVVSDGQGDLTLWDLDLGKLIRPMYNPEKKTWLEKRGDNIDMPAPVALSPDGKTAALGRPNGPVQLWDAEAGKVARTLAGHKAEIELVAFSPDGGLLLSGDAAGVLKLWDVAKGEEARPCPAHAMDPSGSYKALSAAFSADGRRVLSYNHNGAAKLWRVADGVVEREFKTTDGSLSAAALSPTGRFVLTAETGRGRDSMATLRLWEVASGKEALSWRADEAYILTISILPDGRALTLGASEAPKLWDLSAGKHLRDLSLVTDRIQGMAISPDGRRLLGYDGREHVFCWDLARDEEVCTFRPRSGQQQRVAVVSDIVFSPDGKRACLQGCIWDLGSGTFLRKLDVPKDTALSKPAFSPDGKYLLTGTNWFGRAILWDVETGAKVRSFAPLEDTAGISEWAWSVGFSPDGKLAVCAGTGRLPDNKGNLRVFDVKTGGLVHKLEGAKGSVQSATFLPDGRRVLAIDELGAINLWDLDGGNGPTAVGLGRGTEAAWSGDGKTAVFYCVGRPAFLWDATRRKKIRDLEDAEGGAATSAALSPDGSKLFWVGDFTPRLTDLNTGKLLWALPHKGTLTGAWAMAFTPGGELVRVENAHKKIEDARLIRFDALTKKQLSPQENGRDK